MQSNNMSYLEATRCFLVRKNKRLDTEEVKFAPVSYCY